MTWCWLLCPFGLATRCHDFMERGKECCTFLDDKITSAGRCPCYRLGSPHLRQSQNQKLVALFAPFCQAMNHDTKENNLQNQTSLSLLYSIMHSRTKVMANSMMNDYQWSIHINTYYYISSHLLRLKLAKAYLVAWFTVGPGNSVHSSPREAGTPSRDLPTNQGSCFGNSSWAGTTKWFSENDIIDDACATDKQVALCVARQRSPCHWLRPKLSQFALFWTANCMTFQVELVQRFWIDCGVGNGRRGQNVVSML